VLTVPARTGFNPRNANCALGSAAEGENPLESGFLWPLPRGPVRGQAIKPIYQSVPVAAENDPILYRLLALADALRVGSTRERNMASEMLEEMTLREIPWT